MTVTASNFDFLGLVAPRLARLGSLAERYFADDAPAALLKLRQLGEFMAKDVAARHGVLPAVSVGFDEVLRDLKMRSVLPKEIADCLYYLKRLGNVAAHEDAGTSAEALSALKIARGASVWFYRSYGGAPTFRAGPFVPPAPPIDPSHALRVELDRLKALVTTSTDAEVKTHLAAQDPEAALRGAISDMDAKEEERRFWDHYAAETEAARRDAEADVIARECPPGERGKTLLFAAREDHADILEEELRAALTAEHSPQPHDMVEKITGSVDRRSTASAPSVPPRRSRSRGGGLLRTARNLHRITTGRSSL